MVFNTLDLGVIIVFFLGMLAIGIWSHFKNKRSEDYFVAGGKLPWWLADGENITTGNDRTGNRIPLCSCDGHDFFRCQHHRCCDHRRHPSEYFR